jgi:hypothetical protein
MPKIPENKVRIEALIKKETFNKLMELIKTKYQRPHGAISYEVEEALDFWIQKHLAEAHTQTLTDPETPYTIKSLELIMKKLKQLGFFRGNRISINEWKRACAETVGGDKRTWKKYLDYAIQLEYLKPEQFSTYTILK